MMYDSLGDRMKSYENSYRIYIPIRIPIVIRCDGRSFHSYTKGCKFPIDENLIEVMNETAVHLCKNVQGCQLAYVQSDEISLLLINYLSLDSQPWFHNNLQKMASISASMASSIFTANSGKIWGNKIKPATFDSRVFLLPKEEVTNYFLWRQQDATRNSIQMLAQSLYSHKELQGKNGSDLQELCFAKGINWNDCPTFQKRGRCFTKVKSMKQIPNPQKSKDIANEPIMVERSEWQLDNEIPIFSQNRSYIEKFLPAFHS